MMEYKIRGVAPDIEIPFIDLSFVNETACAIRILSSCRINGTYHIFNPHTVTLKEMCMNRGIDNINFEEFMLSLKYDDPLLTHGYYLDNLDLLGIIQRNDLTNHILERFGFSWSSIGINELNTFWDEWIKQADLKPSSRPVLNMMFSVVFLPC